MRTPLLTLALGAALLWASAPGTAMAQPAQPGEAETATQLPPGYVDASAIISRGPEFFEENAAKGNPAAAFFTGYAHIMRGAPDKAYSWMNMAATSNAGITDAWYFMGYLYSAGTTPEGRDLETAKGWFRRAARKGHVNAINQLYFLNLLGTETTPPDPESAFIQAGTLARDNNPVALNNLGVMHEFGIGADQNISQAVAFYRRAADGGNPSGHFNLGRIYEHGKGIDKNIGKATQSYLIAADLGYAPAQLRVGEMMRDGTGFSQNYFNALTWLTRAAQQFNIPAMYEAGLMYQQGKGAKPNINKARSFYMDAAETGHIPSIMKLGELRELGIPSSEDLRQAYSWYHLAYLLAEDNDTKNAAMDERERIAGALPDDDRQSARRQAELQQDSLINLQDAFMDLAEGVSIDMFANPANPRHFSTALLQRALHDTVPADNKN